MWESIVAAVAASGVLAHVVKWISDRRKAKHSDIVKFARIAFQQAIRIMQDPTDAQLVYHQFRVLIDKGLQAAGFSLDEKTEQLIAEVFDALWQVYGRDRMDDAAMELAKAGERAERFAESLMQQVSPGRSR